MNSAGDIKDETTLAAVAEAPEDSERYLLFAIIIDISEPHKTDETSNYVTRLKIIDPSFNYKAQLSVPNLRFHKFVHISIFSETPEAAPRIRFVGDIIRLRRFKFKFSDRQELKGYEKIFSNWLIYSGRKNEPLTPQCVKNFSKNVNRPLTKYEEGRLADLRFWADHFFFVYSMRYITWWVDMPKDKDVYARGRGKVTSKNVDLILRLQKNETAKKRLLFIDTQGHSFELAISNSSLNVGDVIQLKCVDVLIDAGAQAAARVVTLTPNSSCLHIPKFFLDHRMFDRIAVAPRSAAASVRKEAAHLAFLADFTTELDSRGKKSARKGGQGRVVSAIRLNCRELEVTPIAELLRAIEENPQALLSKKFLVEGSITGFISLEPREIVKRFYPQTKEVEPLSQPAQDRRHRAIYHLMPLIRDASLRADQHLQAYILTNESELFIFDAWGTLPSYDDIEGWGQLKENQLQEFVKKLNALKKPEFSVRVVVQLMATPSQKYFYKVVDTVFVNF